MSVISLLVLITGLGLITFLAYYREYNRMLKKRKPDYFGLNTFHEVTRWQSSEWQLRARKKGITLAEWQRLCDEHLDWAENALEY